MRKETFYNFEDVWVILFLERLCYIQERHRVELAFFLPAVRLSVAVGNQTDGSGGLVFF
jgi:hypothetical protein